MSVDDLVEKVARAILWRRSNLHNVMKPTASPDVVQWAPDTFAAAKVEARSAILAVLDVIREPSEAMTRAPDRNVWFGQDDSDLPTVAAFWHAMIDALRASVEKEDD